MHHQKNQNSGFSKYISALILLVLIVCLAVIVGKLGHAVPASDLPQVSASAVQSTPQPVSTKKPAAQSPAPAATPEPPEDTPEPPPTPTPIPTLDAYCTEQTKPENFIKTVGINVDGETLADDAEFKLAEPIDFIYGKDYTDLEGIITFRGNNFRDNAAYGYANLKDYKFGSSWYIQTGSLSYNGETWTGSGWTGQPLIVKWPAKTKDVMNMYDWAKEDDELVEVIYACMDGNVYFLDLETGKQTRDTLKLGYTFKGAGALDPRGYPILYLGAGYDSNYGYSRAFVISLIDGSILYQFGNVDSFTLRGTLSYFDSSALVDAETDHLIYPGENGILYIIKLNTDYNEEAGTLSIAPSPIVKWHYYGKRTSLQSYWVGMEDSACIWRGCIYMADNGGNLMCLDLNTLQLKWVQDTLDDTNGSPVISIENGHPYIYISTSFHLGWRSWTTAKVPVWKIDAENGEIIWQTDFTCYSEAGVSGGVQSTIALGKNDLDGKIYVTVARTDNSNSGVLACLDTKTGEILWEHNSYYTWSSPVLVYNEDGTGTVVYCTYGNNMYMMNGLTGEIYDTFNLYGGAEASPAVYEDTIVIGTRQCRIWGVKLT